MNTARLARLWRLARFLLGNPRNIHLRGIVDQQEFARDYVTRTYGLPLGLPQLDLLDLFPDFSEEIWPYSYLSDGSQPIDLAVLKALARRYEQCSYLEIGTWRGESLANVAQVAHEAISISLPYDDMQGFCTAAQFAENADFYSRNLPNVTHIKADSQTFDFRSLQKKFDLIFIDGDHGTECVQNDTRNAFDLLRDEHAVIVWHDYGFTPERLRWTTLAGILDGSPPACRGHLYQLSNTLCAIYLRGAFPSACKSFPQTPDKLFRVTVSAERQG
jgi:hypothetical protein